MASFFCSRNKKEGVTEPELRPDKQGFGINIGGCFRGGPPSYFAPYRIPTLIEKKEGEYLPQRLADEAIAYVRKNRDRPFFLNWWPYSVHYPIQAREELIAKYRERKGPGIKDPTYAAMIEGMDTGIGRFSRRSTMPASAITPSSFSSRTTADTTVTTVRCVDSRECFMKEASASLDRSLAGVVEPGTTCATPVISMDCYSTLLEAAGLPPTPEHPIDGVSLLPLFEQSDRFDREAVYIHYPNYAFTNGNRLGGVIREGEYKLIKRYRDGELELYHLNSDLGEKKNLAAQSPELANRMERKLNAWLRETGQRCR